MIRLRHFSQQVLCSVLISFARQNSGHSFLDIPARGEYPVSAGIIRRLLSVRQAFSDRAPGVTIIDPFEIRKVSAIAVDLRCIKTLVVFDRIQSAQSVE